MSNDRSATEIQATQARTRHGLLRDRLVRRLIVAAAVVAAALGIAATAGAANSTNGVYFSDGSYADSAAYCSSNVTMAGGYAGSVYAGATYTSTTGIHSVMRIWTWQMNGYTVNAWNNWPATWGNPLPKGSSASYIRNWQPAGEYTIEILYGKSVRGVWETRSQLLRVTNIAYRLRKPVYAPAEVAYTARVTETEGDGMILELIEENPSGEVGFEGTVRVSRTGARNTERPLATAGERP